MRPIFEEGFLFSFSRGFLSGPRGSACVRERGTEYRLPSIPPPTKCGGAGKVYTYTHTMQLLPLPQAKPGVTSRREKRKSGSSSFPSPFLPPFFPFRAICLRAIRKEDETRRRRRRRPPYTPHRRSFLFRLTKAPGIRSGNNCPASWKKGGEQIQASRIANSVAGSYRPLPHSKRAEAHL